MSSVRARRLGARIAVPSMLLAGLAGALVAGPAAGTALASGSGRVNPPSPTGTGTSNGGGTYISTIGGGASGGSGVWVPPPCWVQPYYPQSLTYRASDPSGGLTDADSFYSWFASQEPAASGAASAQGLSGAQMTAEFLQIQQRKTPADPNWSGPEQIQSDDVWWAPNFIGDTSAGWACAAGLATEDDLSNGWIGLQPPLQPGQPSPLKGAINVWTLSEVARAAITLPKISVITSPPATSTNAAVVNTPTYVAVEYAGAEDPSKTVTADFTVGLAPIWASVQATITSVTVSATGGVSSETGFGDQGQDCAAVNGVATPACSVTFSAPSGTNPPETLTVTVTWKVSWSTSAGTGGTFPNTGGEQATQTVVVNEVQSQT
jgi:hypothetical protein